MADSLDVDAMITRFRSRADAARRRNLPPVGGDERKAFLQAQQEDFMDFAIIGDAKWDLTEGVLTFTVDLRPQEPVE
ncbi:MAG: hypothetical protein GY708_08625 [Actinomycetia bacterium]|nr:hypothetical protein [Actinomycetes bacterium]MCP4962590.1 hypothetical protein [Actinomycetes bacterium]